MDPHSLVGSMRSQRTVALSLSARACSHDAKRFDNEGEAEEREEESIEFFKAREDAAETFESAK